MNESKLEIKLAFITGLKEIVLNEISQYSNLRVIKEEGDFIYLDFMQDFTKLACLRSVLRAYITAQDSKYNPLYISNHKSILGNLVAMTIEGKRDKFKTFKIICAGSDSPNVRSIAEYIQRCSEKMVSTLFFGEAKKLKNRVDPYFLAKNNS